MHLRITKNFLKVKTASILFAAFIVRRLWLSAPGAGTPLAPPTLRLC